MFDPQAGEPAAGPGRTVTSSSLADALLVIAEAFLAGKITAADDPEVYQVIVHVGTDALAPGDPVGGAGGQPGGMPADVSAETPAAPQPVPGDPADPARCHVDDGPAVSVNTAQMITCTAVLSWMLHDRDGSVLDLGRRRRRPSVALRRAARERDSVGAGSRDVSPASATRLTSTTGPDSRTSNRLPRPHRRMSPGCPS
jgi:hypothetical protein